MISTDKKVSKPELDSISSEWDQFAGTTVPYESLEKTLTAALVRSESEDLRQEIHSLIQRVPTLFELMNADARGDRSITLLDHSVDTLEQSIDYQAYKFLPDTGLCPLGFAKFLLCHDSGKSLPEKKAEAGVATIKVIDSHNPFLQFSKEEMSKVKALLSYDSIGRIMHCGVCPFDRETEAQFASLRNRTNGDIPMEEREKIDPRYLLKAKHRAGTLTLKDIQAYSMSARVTDDQENLHLALKASVSEIKETALEAGMSVESYFQLMSVYFQLDVSAYSVDVGLKREVGLEFLFEINPYFSLAELEAKKLFIPDRNKSLPLQFSSAAAECYELLKQELGIS